MGDNGSGMERILQLEKIYTSNTRGIHRQAFSTEALLDILVVLYDECNTTVMKRDKRVLDFLEIGKEQVYLHIVFYVKDILLP